MPTILDLAGVHHTGGDGLSLMPLIRGEATALREFAYGEYHPRTVRNQYNHSIITAHERLTLYPQAEGEGWGEYFDHRDDPGEHHNRYHDPACQNRINALRQQLQDDLPAAPRASNKVLRDLLIISSAQGMRHLILRPEEIASENLAVTAVNIMVVSIQNFRP